MKKPTITKEGLILWLRHIQSMSLKTKEHKQRLIDIFVNAVYLYDDKLVITFNYKEASKTVTLKEVNGSIIECSGAPVESLDTQFACEVFFLPIFRRSRQSGIFFVKSLNNWCSVFYKSPYYRISYTN